MRGQGVILLYHSIDDEPLNPLYLAVAGERFDEQMRALRGAFDVVSLIDLVVLAAAGKLDRTAVAVTFDDGYANNLEVALPVLERHDVPATVFVATAAGGETGELYWDELERIFLRAATLPPVLEVEIDNVLRRWDFLDSAAALEVDWKTWEEPVSSRQTAYLHLLAILRTQSHERRRAVLDQIRDWANGPTNANAVRPVLSPDQLVRLARSELIEIGAHTSTHPVLPLLSRSAQTEEIETASRQLVEIVGTPLVSFAYPYGTEADFTGETRMLVRQSGFQVACSTRVGAVDAGPDLLGLPRIAVNDWPGDVLVHRIRDLVARSS